MVEKKRALTPIQSEINKNLVKLENYLGSKEKALHFASTITTVLNDTPKLQLCTPQSVVSAFLKGAELKLLPATVMGQFYVIPYGTKANFQIGYQGVVELLYRGGVDKIVAGIVREKDLDTSSYEEGIFTHKIDLRLSEDERGAIVGAYASAYLNGEKTSIYMNLKDILKHGKQYSKSFNSKDSPWNKDPKWMYKKTAVLQLAKLLPKSADFLKAMKYDTDADSTLTDKINKVREKAEVIKLGNLTNKPNENKESKTIEAEVAESTKDTTETATGE